MLESLEEEMIVGVLMRIRASYLIHAFHSLTYVLVAQSKEKPSVHSDKQVLSRINRIECCKVVLSIRSRTLC